MPVTRLIQIFSKIFLELSNFFMEIPCFFPKSSPRFSVYLGVFLAPRYSSNIKLLLLHPSQQKEVFLLLMDDNLVGVMQGMSLQDDVPIVLPEEDDYSAVERRSRSLLGRLLNSACQNMSRMLRTMTKIWKVYETVLKYGFWTFDDWGMVMERWVEFPPSNFLQSAAVWIRIRNIPVNYLTIKTIDSVAGAIGYVKDSDWNP